MATRNWIGDTSGTAAEDSQVSMKPMLAKLIDEAFRIAVCVSITDTTDKRKIEIFRDVYCITNEEWLSIDPGALCRNICCRFLGTGGWSIRGVYLGNATAREVFEATLANSDQSDLENFVSELGLHEKESN